jgi:uncharacterized phage protein gp47/JayE
VINDQILDQIFPVPKLEEMKKEKINELKKAGFAITNFNSGGVFYTLLMIILQIRLEFVKLFRAVLSQMFVRHATGQWMVLKAEDYSKFRKAAIKATGIVTLYCASGHDTITIPKGTVFKTDKDINGDELRYFSLSSMTVLNGQETAEILVEAEKEGNIYNVSPGRIVNCLTYLSGIERISNEEDWIRQPGADIEDIESLRSRTLNSWSDLATGATADKYKSAAEKIDGVLYADVDQLHPRGQGSVDVIITSTSGAASEELIEKVTEALQEVKGEYDNLLVKSAETVSQDICITAILPRLASEEGIREKILYAVDDYFKIGLNRNLNELILLDIYYKLKVNVPILKNIKITTPQEDLLLQKGNVIMLGNVEITIERES